MNSGIMFTPPLMFFPKTVDDSLPASAAAVVQSPGACEVGTAGTF
ncbi:hypothetical protein [Aliiroseovarius sp.]|nr:hypothetical protein [Aliiroseovarius sp.]